MEDTDTPDLLPARMLNEYSYCPRLFALEWVNAEWAESADTKRGTTVHRRVDEGGGELPEPEDERVDGARPHTSRSVTLSDPDLGLIARLDVVEAGNGEVMPVDTKKGKPAPNAEGAWEPERVQVCAQGLLLRAHGYTCNRGALYFAGARRRVEVPFTDELIALTLRLRDEAMAVARSGELPPPLVDSPKCPRCALVGICLPDESNLLAGKSRQVRPLVPPRDDGMPLYVQLQGGSLGKDEGEIVVRDKGQEVQRARLAHTSRVVVLGNVSVSTPLLRELASRDIPVAWHSSGGWLYGTFRPSSGRNVMARMAQHRAAADPERTLALARGFVVGKMKNARVMLRRNAEGVERERLMRLRELAEDAARASDLDVLRGLEGVAARMYFEALPRMLKGAMGSRFDFNGRNRRPPKDPVNALLSFAYACLARELTHVAEGVGLDPYVGYLHAPRFGRPSLALDLMEEFRPIVADSVVINAINNGVVGPEDFDEHSTGVALRTAARGRFIGVLERRMDEVVTHPVLGVRLSYRRVMEVQARLLAKVLTGELETWPEFTVR